MINTILYFSLLFFTFTDLSEQRIPNSYVIVTVIACTLIQEGNFLFPFLSYFFIAGFVPVLGGGDRKLICVLAAALGISATLNILFISFILVIICELIIGRHDLKHRISLAPYIMGGFLCAGLLRF